jgi:hypothetical protein
MIVATIALTTQLGDTHIPVEVLGKGPRAGTAWVQARNGLTPFPRMSHGGPFQDDIAVISLPRLQEIHIEVDPDEESDEELVEEIPSEIPTIAPDWFLESEYEDRTFIE